MILFQNCSHPGVFADVATGHFLSLHPEFTGLSSGEWKNLFSSPLHILFVGKVYVHVDLFVCGEWNVRLVPDSCKLHFLCHISTRAHLEERSLKWLNPHVKCATPHYSQTHKRSRVPSPDSSSVSTCLLCRCTGPWTSAPPGPVLHPARTKTKNYERFCSPDKRRRRREVSEHTFGSTMLTMTSW